jgi:sugar phosphate isomerase/epimerase
MVDDLSEAVEHGKRFGVIVGIQNHGDFLKTGDETIELIKAVNSEWIGVIVDTGYFLTLDPYVDIEKVLPYGVNFQIKEFVHVCPSQYMTPQLHPTDLIRLMTIIRRSGYRGFLPIETLSAGKDEPYEPLKEVPLFLKIVRKAIAETA